MIDMENFDFGIFNKTDNIEDTVYQILRCLFSETKFIDLQFHDTHLNAISDIFGILIGCKTAPTDIEYLEVYLKDGAIYFSHPDCVLITYPSGVVIHQTKGKDWK